MLGDIDYLVICNAILSLSLSGYLWKELISLQVLYIFTRLLVFSLM